MKDYQIFKKISPFIWKRVLHAVLGLIVILAMIFLAVYLGNKYPEVENAITILCGVIGIYAGWKIIRRGESQYCMGQVAMIVHYVTGKEQDQIGTKDAIRRVRSTFRYSRIFPLIGNIIKHKNLKRVPQYFGVMLTNMIPYVGICNIAWIFAHPEDDKYKRVCHALSNFKSNSKSIRKSVISAFIKEVVFFIVASILIYLIEVGIYLLIVTSVANLKEIVESMDEFNDALETIWSVYFTEDKGYHWDPVNVMVVVAVYVAWFLNAFTIRAYQMINVIRVYLKAGEENPPSDALYERLTAEWEKRQKKKT